MFVVRMLQWPLVILFVITLSLALPYLFCTWFNADEYLLHLQR
jgi:hypothetical protein